MFVARIILCSVLIVVLLRTTNYKPPTIYAQSLESGTTIEATVTEILEKKEIQLADRLQHYQKLELRVDSERDKGKLLVIENGNIPVVNQILYKKGDKVTVLAQKDPDGNDFYFITDFVRRDSLVLLTIVFVLITILIGKTSGIKSLLGMIFSFFMIFQFILPRILAGHDPLWTVTFASVFIIPPTFYLSHGFNRKTSISIVATFVSLLVASLMANYFIDTARLTGYASEEAGFLQAAKGGAVNIKGLLLAGIMIGALGILNDITISQASVVEQLKQTAGKIGFWDLYNRAMKVGQDHIASMVNTLVLVYAGASLPLLLLFINNPHPFSEVVNYEIIAEEIVKTLLSSSALVLAVPLTTLLACWSYLRQSKQSD